MARKEAQFTTFNLSFLDIMSCGFGAVVLVFLIIESLYGKQSEELNQDLMSEVNLLEEDSHRRRGKAWCAAQHLCRTWTWKWLRPRAWPPASPRHGQLRGLIEDLKRDGYTDARHRDAQGGDPVAGSKR